jgi:hypothetical protein
VQIWSLQHEIFAATARSNAKSLSRRNVDASFGDKRRKVSRPAMRIGKESIELEAWEYRRAMHPDAHDDCPGPPGRLNVLIVYHSESSLWRFCVGAQGA